MKGLFISFEGPDGAGKTTQIKMLEEYLKNKGYDVVLTREPGGTSISEQIRKVILDVNNGNMNYMTEALLYAASRAQHVSEVIKASIDDGKIVICDRFVDSSVVYQGIGRNLGIDTVEAINKFAVDDCMPHVTFLFKICPEEGIRRKSKQGEKDRLENEKIDFHKRVYKGYEELRDKHVNRIQEIDAERTIEEIHEDIKRRIDNIL
ncbi:MAG: dTMP kinase [Anaeromicrobium sp.]|jgi:dTMP kinase|uniref:dTMP kinase n=1 Tax=Anaeromicrobium sp. TaxID=1929132 RepID=UPI0025D7C0D2|nr:dTMP kinase [Anaeromicrobium sp.]MCT4593658.1 dTMP kinase [Anaeromicrobium sp.]